METLAPVNIQDPIFILSCARSGSTLLRVALDTHSEVCSPPEMHLLSLCKKLLWANRLVLEDSRPEADIATWSEAIPATREQASTLMARYCEIKQKPRWCEKSITSINHMDVLQEVFPDARQVCLYRHASDMVASGLRATAERADGFDFEAHFAAYPHDRREALLRYWLDRSESLMAAEATDNAFRLRYEDLVSAPDDWLGRLADWLDLAPMADWSARIFQTGHDRGPGDGKIWERTAIDATSVGGGTRLDLSGISRNLIRRVNRCLERLDYQPIP